MADRVDQAITGLVPPLDGESLIRQRWPSVASAPAIASLGRKLTGTIVLAPLGWLIMSLVFFGKFVPFNAKRYTITNRRVMIALGLTRKPGPEVLLKDVDDARVVYDDNSSFFRAGTLEVISKGQVALSMPGLPEPENFKQTLLIACNAWVPDRKRGPFLPASAPAGS